MLGLLEWLLGVVWCSEKQGGGWFDHDVLVVVLVVVVVDCEICLSEDVGASNFCSSGIESERLSIVDVLRRCGERGSLIDKATAL